MQPFNIQKIYPNNGFRSYWKDLSKRTSLGNDNRFSKWMTWFQTASKLTGQVLKDAGIELFFLLIFWYIITKMGQGRDLIVSLFEPNGIYGKIRIVYTILSVISFSVSMWIIPAFLFQEKDRRNYSSRYYRSIFKEHLFFVHRVLPLIPFWLLAFVLFNGKGVAILFIGLSLIQLTLLFLFNEKVKDPEKRKWYFVAILLLFAISFTYFFFIYQKTYMLSKIVLASILYLISFLMYFIYHEVDNRILDEHRKPDDLNISTFNKYKINSLFYLGSLTIHLLIVTFIFTARRIVPIAPESILLYIFSLYVFIIDLFVYFINVSTRRKFIATLVIIFIFLFIYINDSINLNVKHYTIDTISVSSVLKGNERLTFKERYAILKERIQSYKGKESYPIILISGEGGGSRAGMWFSQNLINFDRSTQGRFRDHIFSISTVSGSSVGLSTVFSFWEETGNGGSIDQRWENLPSKVYANNFVGSSISGLLLTDFWKLLVPWVNWTRDRNSMLQDEEAYYTQLACFEVREGRKMNRNESISLNQCLLKKDFMNFFYDTTSGILDFRRDRPLVFINTCRSNDGRRGIISPIKLGNDVFNDAIDIAGYLYEDSVCDYNRKKLCNSNKRNISLGQACNTSELFPLFSAPAYIDSLGSFVDGGYHENSGLKTTLDIYQMLKDTLSTDSDLTGRYKIYIVYLKNGSSEKDLYKPHPSKTPITQPLKALFSQPFEGSASYFEEKTKFVNNKDQLVQYIEVRLNNSRIVKDSAITNKDTIIEKQILRDLLSSIDTTKKDTVLNFPLARWLSKSVIQRMRRDAVEQLSNWSKNRNDSLITLLKSINRIYDTVQDPLNQPKTLSSAHKNIVSTQTSERKIQQGGNSDQ
jgi:hypothetical protein